MKNSLRPTTILAWAVADLSAATAEYESAVPAMRAAADALREAEAVQAKSPKWTRIDEARRMIAQSRGRNISKSFRSQSLTRASGQRLSRDIVSSRSVSSGYSRPRTGNVIAERASPGVCNDGRTPPCRRSPENSWCGRTWPPKPNYEKIVPKAAAPQRAQPRLGSKVDEFAYYTRAHGRGTGGGRRAFGRGAYGPSMRGRTIAAKE